MILDVDIKLDQIPYQYGKGAAVKDARFVAPKKKKGFHEEAGRFMDYLPESLEKKSSMKLLTVKGISDSLWLL